MSTSPPPSLLAIRSQKDILNYAKALLTDTRYLTLLALLIVVGDAVLTQLIIRFVRCKSPRSLSKHFTAHVDS
jgi:hypothetical protein